MIGPRVIAALTVPARLFCTAVRHLAGGRATTPQRNFQAGASRGAEAAASLRAAQAALRGA